MKRLVLSFITLLFVISNSIGSIPKTLSYQGVVTDSNGNPKNDGKYDFVFSIFNDSVSGKSLWSENKTIQTKQGLFSTELGSVSPLMLPFDTQYWLQVEADGTVFPQRTKLTGTPYSFRADTAEVAKGLINIPDHNHDDKYYTKSQADTKFPLKGLGRIRAEGGFATSLETGRDIFGNGLYTYSWYSDAENRPEDANYGSAITWGGGNASSGMGQLLIGWTSTSENYLAFRSLRNTTNNWWPLKRIYHTGYKPRWDDVENKPEWMGSFDPSNYLTNASPYNTNSNTTPFKFTRSSNTNKEYLNIGISDLALHFNYNNDESQGRIEWRIENTDTENSDSTNANTTVLRLFSSDSSSKLLMSRNNGDYYEFWHSGNLTPPEGQSSDIRFKTDIDSIQDPLKKVSSLKGISFNWKHSGFPDRHFPEGRHIGVIAQEVEKILPEVIRTDKDGYKSVAYDKLSAILIEAVKEQQKIIERQENKIDSIKNRFSE